MFDDKLHKRFIALLCTFSGDVEVVYFLFLFFRFTSITKKLLILCNDIEGNTICDTNEINQSKTFLCSTIPKSKGEEKKKLKSENLRKIIPRKGKFNLKTDLAVSSSYLQVDNFLS